MQWFTGDAYQTKTSIAEESVALDILQKHKNWRDVCELSPQLLINSFLKEAIKADATVFASHVKGTQRKTLALDMFRDAVGFPELNINFYKSLEDSLKADLEVAKAAITRWPAQLAELPESIRYHPTIVRIVINAGQVLSEQTLLSLVIKHPENFLLLTAEQRANKMVAANAASTFPHLYKILSEDLQKNNEIKAIITGKNAFMTKYFSASTTTPPTTSTTPTQKSEEPNMSIPEGEITVCKGTGDSASSN
jgi:hypothetical protein